MPKMLDDENRKSKTKLRPLSLISHEPLVLYIEDSKHKGLFRSKSRSNFPVPLPFHLLLGFH